MDLQGKTLVHEIENLNPFVFNSFINFISSYNIPYPTQYFQYVFYENKVIQKNLKPL